jgi:hypothetical protein
MPSLDRIYRNAFIGTRMSIFFVVASGYASALLAAPPDWRWAVGGGAIYSTQGSVSRENEGPSIPKPSIGGSAPGVIVFAEVPLGSILGVGVEMSDTDRLDGTQTNGGALPSIRKIRHHDLIVSGLLHLHRKLPGRVSFDFLVGAGYVREDTSVQLATPLPASFVFGPFGPEFSVTRDTVGATVGADVEVALTRHLSVMPMFRAHFIGRAGVGSATNSGLGLDSTVLRFGVGLRAAF